MPFRMVSGVGRGMGVLDGVLVVEGERVVFGGPRLVSGVTQAFMY